MKLLLHRNGNKLENAEFMDADVLNKNSVALYELELLLNLFDGELAYAVYGTQDAVTKVFTPSTQAVAMPVVETETVNGETYTLCRQYIPNSVFQEAGTKAVSVQVKQPYVSGGGTKYRVATSGIISFKVDESLDGEFEGVDADTASQIQAAVDTANRTANGAADAVRGVEQKVNALLRPPDCTEAGNVGTPEVIITAEGKFKFSNLKGERGEPGQAADTSVLQADNAKNKADIAELRSNARQTSGQVAALQRAVRNIDERLRGVEYLRSPLTGEIEAIEQIIDDLFGLNAQRITSGEYSALGITAGGFDARGLTALEFDMHSKILLTEVK